MQPDHPPYPRPVPYIDVEEDILLPGATIIFGNDNHESDPDHAAARRAAKRRKIQRHAEAYLRGEGISILSVGLRGPFNSIWRNPWVHSDQKTHFVGQIKGLEQAAHNARPSFPSSSLVSHTGRNTSVRPPALKTAPVANPFQRKNNLYEAPQPNEKVEGWLRRNSTLLPRRDSSAPLSPTPKVKSSPIRHEQAPKYRWTPTKQMITVNSQDVRAPINGQSIRVHETFDDDESEGELIVTPNHAHSRLQKALNSEAEKKLSSSTRVSPIGNSAKAIDNTDRAEAEILRLKRQAGGDIASVSSEIHSHQSVLFRELPKNQSPNKSNLERNSLVTPPVSDQEQMENAPRMAQLIGERVKPVSTVLENSSQITNTPWKRQLNTTGPRSIQPALSKPTPVYSRDTKPDLGVNEHLDQTQNGIIMSEAGVHIPHLPTLSTATSDVQANQLHSAQHKPELQTMPSNASSSIKLLEVLSAVVSLQQEEEETNSKEKVDMLEALGEGLPKARQVQLKLEHTMSEPPQVDVPSEEIKLVDDPVEREADAKPVPYADTQASSVLVKSPQMKQRTKRSNVTKRASFVPEASSLSSNGSIRSVLRIRKPNAESIQSIKSPPPPFIDPKISLDNLEDENTPLSTPVRLLRSGRKTTSPAGVGSGRKGILKNRNTPSLASRQNVPVPGIVDDEFDLNGAIDELGSFLSTWDAEKDGLKVM